MKAFLLTVIGMLSLAGCVNDNLDRREINSVPYVFFKGKGTGTTERFCKKSAEADASAVIMKTLIKKSKRKIEKVSSAYLNGVVSDEAVVDIKDGKFKCRVVVKMTQRDFDDALTALSVQ